MPTITYIGERELASFVRQTLPGSGIGFNYVAGDALNTATPGDVCVTERTIMFVPNTTATTDFGKIVQTVREKLGRSVPMIILVSSQAKSELEVVSLSGVRVLENKRDIPKVVAELLQPTT